jgi:hypothetical protein
MGPLLLMAGAPFGGPAPPSRLVMPMSQHTPFVVLLSFAPLLAQDLLPSPIQPVGDRSAVTRSAGLQAARDGVGLHGGGAHYRATFTGAGMRFEPALGRTAPTLQHLSLRPLRVQRGGTDVLRVAAAEAPVQVERAAHYTHAPGIVERFDVRADGVELSWTFATRPAGEGDLVVRYAVDTSLPSPQPANGGLVFTLPGIGGVSIGDVTGIDAAGRRADGDVRWLDGEVELSLPADFVANATYPLVLDPLVGGQLGISSGLTYTDGEPDAAYDATTNRFLVVWQRTLAANNTEVRGQLVSAAGALVGSTIFFSSNGLADRPRVANLGTRDRFGVVWTQLVGNTSTVQIQFAQAGSGALSATGSIASSTTTQFTHADIGSQPDAPLASSRGFVAIWEDNDVDAVRARRHWFNAADALVSSSPFSVFTDTILGSSFEEPAISRAAGPDGKLLVVARRDSALFTNSAIEAAVVDAGSNTVGALVTMASSSVDELFAPDVDGFAGKWVVAWERDSSGPNFYDSVRATSVFLDGSNSLVVGSGTTFGGTLTVRASAPSLGYTAGRTWLGYQQVNVLPSSTTTLRVAAIDSGTCASCADTFSVGFPDGPRIVVATMTSGGDTAGELCLAVYTTRSTTSTRSCCATTARAAATRTSAARAAPAARRASTTPPASAAAACATR